MLRGARFKLPLSQSQFLSCSRHVEKMKFLIVDDHALIRDAMHGVVMEICRDARVLEAANAVEALTLAASHADIDLVLLDVMLPDRDNGCLAISKT